MRPVNLGDVAVDECRFCDGLWLDREDPEKLSKLDVLGKHLLQPMTFDDSKKRQHEGERLCPRCTLVLDVHSFRGVDLDICSGCRGMFLDRWELQELFK